MIRILSDQAVCDVCGLVYNPNYQACPECVRKDTPSIIVRVKKHTNEVGICGMCSEETELFAKVSKEQGGGIEKYLICMRCYDTHNLQVRK